ncbi:MAG: glutathione transferase [Deltaproteobacteria bacterium]|nr:glutathione transferase [Deltaproteobacteria bacterium]
MTMSDLVLYGNKPLTSPYVMSVFVALAEKGLAFDFVQLSLDNGEHLTAGHIQLSLTNRVPTLVHEGFALSESSAITEYLEERFPPPQYARLYPADLHERARVRMVQALIRSDFLPIREERSTDTVFANVPPKPLSPVAAAAAERLHRIAGTLIQRSETFLASDFSIADVDLAMMLQRLLSNGDPVPPTLADYASRIWSRPSVLRWLALTGYRAR